MNDEEAIERSYRAYNELTETQAIFEKMRQNALEKLIATPLEAGEWREKLYRVVTTINTVERALREAVDAGEVSKFALHQAEMLRP